MAITPVTVTFKLVDFLGYVPDIRRTKVLLDTNVDSGFLVDTTTGGSFRIADAAVTIDSTGLASFSILPSGATGLNPSAYQIRVRIDAANPVTRRRETIDLGWYTITAAADLKDLVAAQYVPPTYLSTVTATLDSKVTAAEIARDEAEAAEASAQALVLSDLGTTDGQTRALIENPASQTAVALSATYGRLAYGAVNVLDPEFGAVGDGVADDTAEIQAALTATSVFARAGIVVIPEGTYKVTGTLTVPDGIHVIANGAVINYAGTSTTAPCFNMGNQTSLTGATIDMTNQVGGSGPRAHVLVGNYNTGVGVSGVTLSNLTLTGGHDDSNGILVTGDSHNVTIDNIKVPDNARMGRVVMAHWGNADNHNQIGPTHTAGTYTTHPHNISIRNVKVGSLSLVTANAGSAVVLLSAAYNVSVENVRAEGCETFLNVFPSDYGFAYASAEVAAIGASGISFKNCTARNVRKGAVVIKGQPFYEAASRLGTVVSIDNVRVEGDGVTTNSGNSGFELSYTLRTTIRNSQASGFYMHGVYVATLAKDTTVENCTAYSNRRSGFVALGSSGSEPSATKFSRCRAYANGTGTVGGVSQTGFGMQSARNTVIEHCIAGETGTETQLYGIYHGANSRYDMVLNNEIRNVAATGIGISTNSAYDDIELIGNRASSTAFTFRNSTPTRLTIDGRKVAWASAAPTNGTWGVGDVVWNTGVAAGGSPGWVCTTAGTPGTWKAMANVAA